VEHGNNVPREGRGCWKSFFDRISCAKEMGSKGKRVAGAKIGEGKKGTPFVTIQGCTRGLKKHMKMTKWEAVG